MDSASNNHNPFVVPSNSSNENHQQQGTVNREPLPNPWQAQNPNPTIRNNNSASRLFANPDMPGLMDQVRNSKYDIFISVIFLSLPILTICSITIKH